MGGSVADASVTALNRCWMLLAMHRLVSDAPETPSMPADLGSIPAIWSHVLPFQVRMKYSSLATSRT
jgi:hypothetical protein